MAAHLHLLCAGAAKALLLALQPEFERASGVALRATFGAVGAMRDLLDSGAPCDLVVLTRSMIDALAAAGRVDAASCRDIGWVHTGVAVPANAPAPILADVAGLRVLLASARAIYLPDPLRATAGIHALRVLRELGEAETADRLRAQPNGAAAMAAMAHDADPAAVGVTQVSEILYTPGLRLLGVLPPPYALATLYSAAVVKGAPQATQAAYLSSLLTGPAQAPLRQRGGFETQ